MSRFRVHAIERFRVRTVYHNVEADSAAEAESRCRSGLEAYEATSIIEDAGEEWVETLEVEALDDDAKRDADDDNCVISAVLVSDNREHVVQFDAEPWFQKADFDDIRKLAKCDWGGDAHADNVAIFMRSTNRILEFAFTWLERHDCGYEVYVSEADAMAWLLLHRPQHADALIAEFPHLNEHSEE